MLRLVLITVAFCVTPTLLAQKPCLKCGKVHPTTTVAAKTKPALLPFEINRDQRAYEFAKREALMMAKSRRVKHYLGVAPGCRLAGVGNSYNGRPNHCYDNYPTSRIVARACVYRNGIYYWSCHLR